MKHCDQAQEPLLIVSGVTLGYPGIIALTNITFTVNQGEFIGIAGPNGSGKSTLLKGILSLLPVQSGVIRYCGYEDRSTRLIRKHIGYVPQKNKTDVHFPALVREVVLMGLYAQIGWVRRPQKIHYQMVLDSLQSVGMADYSEHPIGELSGGQQQRVMIARALVSKPRLLILDEPTAAVDIYAQRSILDTLEKLNREKEVTILMVSHDINEIVHSCDKIILLNRNLSVFGTANEVLTRENLVQVYGDRIYVYEHHGHPHVLVGDFDE
ncbi:MAG TPA: metal ABC transporter ATP-binding protein [Bacillota bacterium]